MLDLRFLQQCCWRSSFLGCYNVLLVSTLAHFEGIIFLQNVGTTHPMTQCHIPEDFKLQWVNPLMDFYGWEVFKHCTGWVRSHHTLTQFEPKVSLSLHSTAHTTIYSGSVATVSKRVSMWEPLPGSSVVLSIWLANCWVLLWRKSNWIKCDWLFFVQQM